MGNETETSGSFQSLPTDEWRYHVISFGGNNQTLNELQEAFCITPLELKVGFTILGKGVSLHFGRMFQFLDNSRWNTTFLEVAESDAEAIRETHALLQQHDHAVVDLRRLTRQLLDLDAIPVASPLRFLGYFAVLESLLTHPPRPTDPYDSITRQVKKKIALLNRRCKPEIDYSAFAGANADKLWTKMYEYRSHLAHGGTPDFDRNLSLLRGHTQALDLLRRCVKAVMRQALIEPQLVSDLREC